MLITETTATKLPPQQFLIHEKKSDYTKHDQLFKQLIKAFFKEFIEAFYPELHEQIDFRKITFLSEEKYTEVIIGDKRLLDLVVEVKWKETDALIVVHVEPQSYEQKDFNNRMFKYFSMLYNTLEKPILPIAIFSYEEDWNKDEFIIRFSDLEVLRFNYLTLHLRKKNWLNFIKRDNPVSAALLSKMGYKDDERVQVKLDFYKILARLKMDKEKESLLIGFFDSYLQLNEEEEETFMAEARELENADEILKIPISYEERGKELGKEMGREEGRLEEKKEIALKMLREGLDAEIIMKITQMKKEEVEQLRERL